MAPDEQSGEQRPGESLPEVPDLPVIPEAPTLKPRLPPKPRRPEDEQPGALQQAGLAYSLPASLIAPIIVLTLAGYWLDGRLNTSPICTIGGAILGAVSGFLNMIRIANRLNR